VERGAEKPENHRREIMAITWGRFFSGKDISRIESVANGNQTATREPNPPESKKATHC
jgi:hypothetical protein